MNTLTHPTETYYTLLFQFGFGTLGDSIIDGVVSDGSNALNAAGNGDAYEFGYYAAGVAGSLFLRSGGVAKAAGSGPAKGFLEVSSNFKSSKAVQNLTNSKPIDFIFDPKSQRFIMGRNSLGHDGIRMAGNIGHKDIVGGSIWRQNGKLMTDQSSGHYGTNWTASIRAQFTKFMKQNGVDVSHSTNYRK